MEDETAPTKFILDMFKQHFGHERDREIFYGGIPGSVVEEHYSKITGGGGDLDKGHQKLRDKITLGYLVENDLSCIPALIEKPAGWNDGEGKCTHDKYLSTLDFFPQMDRVAQDRGAQLVMQMAHGYRFGGPNKKSKPGQNEWKYLDHHEYTMKGWDSYADAVKSKGRDPLVAPAGVAFRLIYRDDVKNGKDPLEDSSPFSKLFRSHSPDGKDNDNWHPSYLGFYLTYCVVFGTITGQLPKNLQISDALKGKTGITQADATRMQKYASEALQKCGSLGNTRARIPCAGLKY